MAKTKGALFSINAHGSVAKLMTYQGRRHFNHVHRKPTPRNPKSSSQTTNRNDFAEVVSKWHLTVDADKRVYTVLGYKFGFIPGFNAFIKINIRKTYFWARFGEVKFGQNKKFGGPLGSQIT